MASLSEGPHAATVDRITLDVDGDDVPAIHARPDTTALGGVAMVPDIGGIRPLFDDLCRRLATHGLAVCAIEPFFRMSADVREQMSLDDRLAEARDLYDDAILAALDAAADHLTAADSVHGVAVSGFCIGGYYTLKAAATGRFERAVSFYGMIRTPGMWDGPGHESPIDGIAAACPTLLIVGDLDPWVPLDDIEALRAEWRDRDDCKVVVYRRADHGFVHDPDRDAHRPDDADDAWRKALAWFLDDDGGSRDGREADT